MDPLQKGVDENLTKTLPATGELFLDIKLMFEGFVAQFCVEGHFEGLWDNALQSEGIENAIDGQYGGQALLRRA